MAIVLSLVVTRRVLAEFVAAVVALKKEASLESPIRNARERRAALRLILMRSSRAVLSAIFSRHRTLKKEREREREGVNWLSHERSINFESDRWIRATVPSPQRRLRESGELLSFFSLWTGPKLVCSLCFLSQLTLLADTARGGHGRTIRYDRRCERFYLDSSREKRAAKERLC